MDNHGILPRKMIETVGAGATVIVHYPLSIIRLQLTPYIKEDL